jgi:hypothetical protein
MSRRLSGAAVPALAMTAVSMALTLAVVVAWLGAVMPWPLALLVGAGLDGAWLSTLAYERRLAAQGDHSGAVTALGWAFGLVATGVLVIHALSSAEGTAAWLAVTWLPLAAKALWLVHGLWERTALTPRALGQIQEIRQEARDTAAVSRALLHAQAGAEETRLEAVTAAGARVARVQARTARTLSEAWSGLQQTASADGMGDALTCVTTPVTPGVTPRWDLPVWGPTTPLVPALGTGELTDEALDAIVTGLRDSEDPPLSYREMSHRFRRAGHAAGETRLRASWRRVTGDTAKGA